MPSYKLCYFDARGFGEMCRLLFAEAGVEYEDVRVNDRTWPEEKPIIGTSGVVPSTLSVSSTTKASSSSTTLVVTSDRAIEETSSVADITEATFPRTNTMVVSSTSSSVSMSSISSGTTQDTDPSSVEVTSIAKSTSIVPSTTQEASTIKSISTVRSTAQEVSTAESISTDASATEETSTAKALSTVSSTRKDASTVGPVFIVPATDDKCLNNNCSSNSNCYATDGSYKCTCRDGFIGDGFHCKSRDAFKNSLKMTNVSSNASAMAVASSLTEFVSSSNTSEEDYQSVVLPALNQITSAVLDGSVEVNPSLLTPVAKVLSKLTKNYFKPKTPGTPINLNEKAERGKIIQSITGMARLLKFDGEIYEQETDNFTIRVQKYNETSGQGLAANFSSVNVNVPDEIFKKQRRRKRQSDEEFAASFVLFDDTTLFDTEDFFDLVISIDVGEPGSVKDLDTPVTIEHKVDTHPGRQTNPDKPAEVTSTELNCVFWDDKTSDWASNGCCLKPDTDPPQCSCDHLTNFALLVSEKVSTDVVLDLVSDIGCYLSIFGLLISMIIHLYFRKSRKIRQTQFLIHICFNLIVAYSLFVGGISRAANKTVCNVVAALLHYFFLTSWCWMVVYCYEMKRSILASGDVPKRYTQKTVMFAYGIPLVIVGVTTIATLGILDQRQPSLYCDEVPDPMAPSLYRSENYCWLHGHPLLIGFLLPVAIMLFHNILRFVQVVKRLNSMEISTADGSSPKHTAGTAIILTAVVGVGWGFGYLILIAPESKFAAIFSWFFAAFVVLQGVAIFVMTVFQCKVLRNEAGHNGGSGSNGGDGENLMIQISSSSSSTEAPPSYDKIDEKSKPATDDTVF